MRIYPNGRWRGYHGNGINLGATGGKRAKHYFRWCAAVTAEDDDVEWIRAARGTVARSAA